MTVDEIQGKVRHRVTEQDTRALDLAYDTFAKPLDGGRLPRRARLARMTVPVMNPVVKKPLAC